MLLKTGIVLEHLHDLEMYEMIESGLRGGMVQVSKKYVKANNKPPHIASIIAKRGFHCLNKA